MVQLRYFYLWTHFGAPLPKPAKSRAFVFVAGGDVYVGYFDEFGHNGAYVSRFDPSYKTHPVLGLGGFVIPAQNIRKLSGAFRWLRRTATARGRAVASIVFRYFATDEREGMVPEPLIRLVGYLKNGYSQATTSFAESPAVPS